MQLDDAATILARTEFFQICDGEQRRLLAFASERKRHRSGTLIYKAGDVPEGAHVLVSGTVATFQGEDETNPFVVSKPGSLFGANSLVIERSRPVTLKAIDQVETLFVPRSAFMKLCTQYPDLAGRAAARIRQDLVGYLDEIETTRGKLGSSKG